jgi:hypothetical protein
MSKYGEVLLFVTELALALLFVAYLIVFQDMTIKEIWNEYGIPILIYIVIFTAYPLFRLYQK